MTCKVLLFAVARDRAGSSSLTVDVPSGATAHELVSACVAAAPGLASLASSLRVAMDQTLVSEDTTVRDGAELALLPPVSGG